MNLVIPGVRACAYHDVLCVRVRVHVRVIVRVPVPVPVLICSGRLAQKRSRSHVP